VSIAQKVKKGLCFLLSFHVFEHLLPYIDLLELNVNHIVKV
jgi:hypothetical protein